MTIKIKHAGKCIHLNNWKIWNIFFEFDNIKAYLCLV